jgi:hypothetical protein
VLTHSDARLDPVEAEQADKSQYRALLTALSGVTGKRVETITDKGERKK